MQQKLPPIEKSKMVTIELQPTFIKEGQSPIFIC